MFTKLILGVFLRITNENAKSSYRKSVMCREKIYIIVVKTFFRDSFSPLGFAKMKREISSLMTSPDSCDFCEYAKKSPYQL